MWSFSWHRNSLHLASVFLCLHTHNVLFGQKEGEHRLAAYAGKGLGGGKSPLYAACGNGKIRQDVQNQRKFIVVLFSQGMVV